MERETTIRKYNYICIVKSISYCENKKLPRTEKGSERGSKALRYPLTFLVGLHARCDNCGSVETNFNVDDNAVTGHIETRDAKTLK